MNYVNLFMKSKGIPKELRVKIRRYLEYNWELKKTMKIEEEEVMGLLNEDLASKITVFLNGRILQSISCLQDFPIDFLSQLTFIFIKKTFAVDENIIYENDQGQEIYFISQGRASLLHKETHTYIGDLAVSGKD